MIDVKAILKNKKVLSGVAVVGVATVIGCSVLNQPKKTSDMNEIKTKQSTKKTTMGELEKAKDKVIFEEGSKKASDGLEIVQGDYNIDDLVKLADLKSFSATNSPSGPTREDALVQARLAVVNPLETTDKSVQVRKGDTVVVDIDAKVDGKEVPYLSARGQTIKVGAIQYDRKLEDAIVGMKLEDKLTKDISYEDDYKDMSRAGKKVTYKITVTKILRPAEPDDATVDSFLKILNDNATYSKSYNKVKEAKAYLKEKSEFKAYPAKLIDKLQKEYNNFAFGTKYKDETEYLDKTGTKKKDFEAGRSEYVMDRIKDEMILEALSKQSGITMDSDEFKSVSSDLFTADQKRDLLYEVILNKMLG